jgi:hypothetical protein
MHPHWTTGTLILKQALFTVSHSLLLTDVLKSAMTERRIELSISLLHILKTDWPELLVAIM